MAEYGDKDGMKERQSKRLNRGRGELGVEQEVGDEGDVKNVGKFILL